MILKESTKRVIEGDYEDIGEDTIELPIINYVIINIIVFCLPLYPSMFLILGYFRMMNYIHADTLFGLTSANFLGIPEFWSYLFLPVSIILSIFVYILGVVFISSLFTEYWNRKSPPVQGLFRRTFSKNGAVDQRINYYHYRGFIIKFPLWLAYKSPFPWMINWILRKIGHNDIKKDVVIMEAFPSLEFTDMASGSIFYPASSSSSHVVDSIFGNLSLSEVSIGKNAIIHPHAMVGPGSLVENENNIMAHTLCPKEWRRRGDGRFHSGSPARPIDHYYRGIFSILPEKAGEIYSKNGYLTGKDIENLN